MLKAKDPRFTRARQSSPGFANRAETIAEHDRNEDLEAQVPEFVEDVF